MTMCYFYSLVSHWKFGTQIIPSHGGWNVFGDSFSVLAQKLFGFGYWCLFSIFPWTKSAVDSSNIQYSRFMWCIPSTIWFGKGGNKNIKNYCYAHVCEVQIQYRHTRIKKQVVYAYALFYYEAKLTFIDMGAVTLWELLKLNKFSESHVRHFSHLKNVYVKIFNMAARGICGRFAYLYEFRRFICVFLKTNAGRVLVSLIGATFICILKLVVGKTLRKIRNGNVFFRARVARGKPMCLPGNCPSARFNTRTTNTSLPLFAEADLTFSMFNFKFWIYLIENIQNIYWYS